MSTHNICFHREIRKISTFCLIKKVFYLEILYFPPSLHAVTAMHSEWLGRGHVGGGGGGLPLSSYTFLPHCSNH